DAICTPFMNQIAVSPPVSRHSRSALPSPSKSRCPTIDQLVGTAPISADDRMVAPFISQIAVLPRMSRQAMSLLWSPLKSWVLGLSGLEAVKIHVAPRNELSCGPPMIAVRPSADRAAETPCSARNCPIAPVPTSLLPCWVHTPLLRVNTHTAPVEKLSP